MFLFAVFKHKSWVCPLPV